MVWRRLGMDGDINIEACGPPCYGEGVDYGPRKKDCFSILTSSLIYRRDRRVTRLGFSADYPSQTH